MTSCSGLGLCGPEQWDSVRLLTGLSTELLTELPQFLGHHRVSGVRRHLVDGAAGEVVTAQGLQAFLQATVQRRLSSSLRVQEEEAGHRLDEDLLPQTNVTRQFGPDDTCRTTAGPTLASWFPWLRTQEQSRLKTLDCHRVWSFQCSAVQCTACVNPNTG